MSAGRMAAFVAARFDEDEKLARQALAEEPADRETRYPYPQRPARCMHDARHGPARVLREVEAGRELLRDYQGCCGDPQWDAAIDLAVRYRALSWSDHPDYDPAWAVQP